MPSQRLHTLPSLVVPDLHYLIQTDRHNVPLAFHVIVYGGHAHDASFVAFEGGYWLGSFHVPEGDAVVSFGNADEEEVAEGGGVKEGGDGGDEAGSFDFVDLGTGEWIPYPDTTIKPP